MRSVAIRMKLKRVWVNQREHELGLLPPPLWGRGGEGGGAVWQRVHANLATPTPNPSPQGGGERTSVRRAMVPQTQTRLSEPRDANKQQCCQVTPARAGGMPADWRSWFAPVGRSD